MKPKVPLDSDPYEVYKWLRSVALTRTKDTAQDWIKVIRIPGVEDFIRDNWKLFAGFNDRIKEETKD